MNCKTCFHLLSVLSIQSFLACLPVTAANLTTDQFALLEFKDRIVDPRNVLANNWTTSSSVCNWVGVSCGLIHERVTSLNLTNMNLLGTIPPHLSNLSFLISLDLSSNNFYGSLPKELSQLRRLRLLRLSFNRLNGEIPSWLESLHKINVLNMRDNGFRGTIPQTLVNMSNLEVLNLAFNHLDGQIPPSIFNISSLKIFVLDSNSILGSLPDDLCHHLPNLQGLYLSMNALSGNIPSSIGKCSNLQTSSLGLNQFSGIIPRSIGNLTKLKELYWWSNIIEGNLPPFTNAPNLEMLHLTRNKLSGNIPNSIANASMLKILELAHNFFSGQIPDTLGNLRHLHTLHLQFNNLTTKSASHEWSFLSSLANCRNLTRISVSGNPLNGVLPTYIGNLSTSLQYFVAYDCELKGKIAMEVGNLSNLLGLALFSNKLSGSIPISIGGLRNLQGLSLSGNKFRGPIPETICGLERLDLLELWSNKLHGPVLPCLGNMTSLRHLDLHSNKLSGAIPSTLWNLKDILVIDLSSNYLIANSHSLDVGGWRSLLYLNLSRNLLTGDISPTIEGLLTLTSLDLSNNQLHGHIPDSFGGLVSLEFLDLCNNSLSGLIPPSLEKLLHLHQFNVSFNRLEGEIPNNGCFPNFSSSSFMNNYALCGPPRLLVPPCRINSVHQNPKKTILLALRYGVPTFGIIVMLIVLAIIYRRRQSRTKALPIKVDLLPSKPWRRISQAELSEATGGFEESNILGSGSFGCVYKGRLSDGMEVAIKVFSLHIEGAFRSFEIECEAMRNVVHRNLVRVITCCSNIDFKALVLDFMSNGSLDKWLHAENCFLDILRRVEIMIDVAMALEHLHTGHPTPIIHCDLKPSNILLDEDMVAHLGDFGISKLLGEGDVMKQTLTLATIGYMAPEFGSTGIVSIKCDVYSYGIVLIETFTKKKPTDEIFGEEMTIRHWMQFSLSKGTMDTADSDLLTRKDEYFVVKANCISSLMELALHCSAELPEDRKDMKDVVVELKKIKQRFLNSLEHV